jgi:hypothetical protein
MHLLNALSISRRCRWHGVDALAMTFVIVNRTRESVRDR